MTLINATLKNKGGQKMDDDIWFFIKVIWRHWVGKIIFITSGLAVIFYLLNLSLPQKNLAAIAEQLSFCAVAVIAVFLTIGVGILWRQSTTQHRAEKDFWKTH